MKRITKILAVVLALCLVICAFAACSQTETNTDSEKVYKIGICQLVQHPALDAATEGFQDKLTELIGEGKVEFDLQNAAGESSTCATIANQFVSANVDLIMANATPAVQAASTATTTIPVVGTAVTEYGVALEIPDFTGKTGINVTGASDLAPLGEQAAMFSELLPKEDYPVVGMLYCSAEANSKYQVDNVTKYLQEAGYEVKEYSFSDSNDIASVLNKAVADVDSIYIPTDNQAANNTELINNICEPAGIPIIAGEEGICKGCGIATLSISYYDLGVATAKVAYEILVNGAEPGETPIAYAENVTKECMPERAAALGITIPDTYTAIAAD